MDAHHFVITDRTRGQTWSVYDKESAIRFLLFVVDDFVRHGGQIDTASDLMGDFFVSEYNEQRDKVNTWLGRDFMRGKYDQP